ncbi:MAG: PEPxxWA-CTERM sorting domain-containing protein [Sphingomonadaceae bacterium]
MRNILMLAAGTMLLASPATAANLAVVFENFTYSGTVTDPGGTAHVIQTATNGPRETRPDARDGAVLVRSGATGKYGTDLAQVATAWYFTTITPFVSNGFGNPNNSNNGFLQYLENVAGLPGVTISGGWTPNRKRFILNLSGGTGDASNAARLWNAPAAGGPVGDTAGSFQSFHLALTASFANPAVFNPVTGWYEQWNVMPTAVSGTIGGTFLNDSTTNPGANGLYSFAFTLNGPGSWAADTGAFWGSDTNPNFVRSRWASDSIVPEPATWAMMIAGFGLVGAGLRRRRLLPA